MLRKHVFVYAKNKGTDQLNGNNAADLRFFVPN